MATSLDGIVFSQFYGDNSGGTEFDTDGDGDATQEDEFVSFLNTSGGPVDLSGWQIWSDMTGTGAPDGPQDGLYHTFEPGTILQPGETLFVINEYSGTTPSNFQEASEGGLESGAGGDNTNYLSEGGPAGQSESVALVNPVTGEYIILNLTDGTASTIPGLPGFPGTTLVGESNAAAESGVEDQNAGSSYQYNSATGSYEYNAVNVTCFAAGTRIATPSGARPVEDLTLGDLVLTMDRGPQPIRYLLRSSLDFEAGADACHKPVEFKPGSLGRNIPRRRLIVSPQHRILLEGADGRQVLAPAKGLTDLPGVRRMEGRKAVQYLHLVFDQHEIVLAEGCWSESYFPGAYSLSMADRRTRSDLQNLFAHDLAQVRPFISVKETLRIARSRQFLDVA